MNKQLLALFTKCVLLGSIFLVMSQVRAQDRVEYLGKPGLYDPPFSYETTLPFAVTVYQSNPSGLSENGHAMGTSTGYSSALHQPIIQGAWIANLNADIVQTTRVGLFDETDYTSSDGYQESETEWIAKSGYVIGNSTRYYGSYNYVDNNGEAVWVANPAGEFTTRVGLYGGEFTRGDTGYEKSEVTIQSDDKWYAEKGYFIGQSTRYYNGTPTQYTDQYEDNGEAAWVAKAGDAVDATTSITTRLGYFTDSEYSGTDGYQSSEAVKVTKGGYLIGTSERFRAHPTEADVFVDNGQAAWFVDATQEDPNSTIKRLGFYAGPEYSKTDSLQQSSEAVDVTENGYVVGNSTRFRTSGNYAENGQSAWFVDASQGSTAIRVGLFNGNEYTDPTTGYALAEAVSVTESGYVIGNSYHLDENTGAYNGQASWVVTNAQDGSNAVQRVGLTDSPEFATSSGWKFSEAVNVIESGYVIGHSTRFSGAVSPGNDTGQAAWVANASTGVSTRVGLYNEYASHQIFDAANPYTDVITGEQSSEVESKLATQSGYFGGSSQRYTENGDENGEAAWVAKAQTGETIRVGLDNDVHTGSHNKQESELKFLSEEGLAAGSSTRYDNTGNAFGETAWVFDLNTGVQYDFTLSISDTGYAFSEINGITSTGFVYGAYSEYEATPSGAYRAFVWSLSTGTILLSEEVIGGMPSEWYAFANASFMNSSGIVLGEGWGQFNQQGVYAVGVVPEPETALLLLLGLGGTWLLTRKRKSQASK